MDTWHTSQHYVIVNEKTGNWVQQSFTPDLRAVNALNDHEVRNGRCACYVEKYFSSEEIKMYASKKSD